uniref:Uncharacterized protein n=1 Tax=Anguilla anguilla TaxID=7936 RepID=A0A0E9XUT7_ANGAN
MGGILRLQATDTACCCPGDPDLERNLIGSRGVRTGPSLC